MKRSVSIAFLTFLLLFRLSLAEAGGKIVILPFDSLAEEDISFIQEVVPKLLSTRLAAMTGWEVALTDLKTPAEANAKRGPTYVVSGAITRLGSTYSLDIVVHDPTGEKVGGYFSSAQDKNGILASLEGLAKDVAESLPGVILAKEEVVKPETAADVPEEEPTGEPGAEVVSGKEVEKEKAESGMADVQGEEVSYTEIKKVKTLGTLPGEIYKVAVADVDGDGNHEIAFMGRYTIFIYRFREGEMKPLRTIEKDKNHHFLNIDTFDVDKDGVDDFVVTNLVGNFLDSFVVGSGGERIKIKIEDIDWYLSVFDDYGGKKRLIGQGTGNESPYSDRAYVMEWDGEKLRDGEKMKVPRNEELVMSAMNMNAFSDEGKQRFILLDQYEKLRVADEEGMIFWKSGEYYSGALDYIESSELELGLMEKMRFYMTGRLKRVFHNDKTAILVREAPRPFLGQMRSLSWSRIVLLEWDGGDFVKKIEGEKLNKLITDYSLIESGDGITFIVSPVVISQGNIKRKGKTKIELFELVREKVKN